MHWQTHDLVKNQRPLPLLSGLLALVWFLMELDIYRNSPNSIGLVSLPEIPHSIVFVFTAIPPLV